VALVVSGLFSQGVLGVDTIVYLEIDASRMIDATCVTPMRFPAHMAVTGLAVHAQRQELYGTDGGFLFRIPLDGGSTSTESAEGMEFLPIVVSNATAGSSRIVSGLRGCAVSSMTAYVGAMELGVARVYEVELETAKVTRVFLLTDADASIMGETVADDTSTVATFLQATAGILVRPTPESGIEPTTVGGINIAGLAFLTETNQLAVGSLGNGSTTILLFDVPVPSSTSSDGEDEELVSSSSFTPLKGANGLRALTAAKGHIYSIFDSPALVVVNDAGTGAPLRVLSSLDVRLDAMAIEVAEAGQHRTYVHSPETPNVLEYSLPLESGSFSSCTPSYASRLGLTAGQLPV
jgi:hypothetical protein